MVSSVLLALGGVAAIAIGALAWTMERPSAARVESNVAVVLGESPWFDPGSTLFAAPVGDERSPQPGPAQWACLLIDAEGERELVRRPDRDQIGTRVVDGVSVVPVVTIGATRIPTELLCTGVAAQSTSGMWVLPTDPGVQRAPLALVVGGIALLGMAAVVHPRGRGIRPFGR